MKQQIREFIQKAIGKLYPEHKDIVFSVDYAPDNIDADFASNAALIVAKQVGKKPMEIAEQIKARISDEKFEIEVAKPGFLNFVLPPEIWRQELSAVLQKADNYGSSEINRGKKARVEYVSANPTGPIHIGNARGGPYGETICKVLEWTGYQVLGEYFHNDIGGQVDKLGQTVWYWYQNLLGKEIEFPEGGYQGEYLKEVARTAMKELGEGLTVEDLSLLTEFALNWIYEENSKLLGELGIEFGLVIKESELRSSGKTEAAVKKIKSQGLAKEKEGAWWFAPNDEFLQDREAVIVKSDGNFTYFASDIAYHGEKFTSGYDLVIDILGSNHHGHVPKLKALTKLYGFAAENFHVLVYQYVRVKKGSEVVKMSKRAGTYVTAREVLDEVGKDSMIFTLLMTAINTHVDFDLQLAKDTTEKNPMYKVQYAHARINSILRKAGSDRTEDLNDLNSLSEKIELDLIKELSKFPGLIEEISQQYTVHHLPHYLLALAEKFHAFYEKVRVIGDEKNKTRARLILVKGVRTVLANGLKLMGIEPLEKM